MTYSQPSRGDAHSLAVQGINSKDRVTSPHRRRPSSPNLLPAIPPFRFTDARPYPYKRLTFFSRHVPAAPFHSIGGVDELAGQTGILQHMKRVDAGSWFVCKYPPCDGVAAPETPAAPAEPAAPPKEEPTEPAAPPPETTPAEQVETPKLESAEPSSEKPTEKPADDEEKTEEKPDGQDKDDDKTKRKRDIPCTEDKDCGAAFGPTCTGGLVRAVCEFENCECKAPHPDARLTPLPDWKEIPPDNSAECKSMDENYYLRAKTANDAIGKFCAEAANQRTKDENSGGISRWYNPDTADHVAIGLLPRSYSSASTLLGIPCVLTILRCRLEGL